MGKKINIAGDYYDEHVIAFIRRLKKPIKQKWAGESAPARHYLIQLRVGYSIDGKGKSTSIWLSKEEGEGVLKQLDLLRGVDIKREDSETSGQGGSPNYKDA